MPYRGEIPPTTLSPRQIDFRAMPVSPLPPTSPPDPEDEKGAPPPISFYSDKPGALHHDIIQCTDKRQEAEQLTIAIAVAFRMPVRAAPG